MGKPLIFAVISYFLLVGLAYLVSAIVLLSWQLILAPAIVNVSNRNVREKMIEQGLFYKQTKVLSNC